MTDGISRLRTPPAFKQWVDHPVIDAAVRTDDRTPHLEDYVACYGDGALVDELRASPAWTDAPRDTGNGTACDRPELFCERQAEQGTDHSLLFPDSVLASLHLDDFAKRQRLQHAVNHHHADLWRKHRGQVTPVAGIPLGTPAEGVAQLEFAVKRLGFKAIAISGTTSCASDEYDYTLFWTRVVELRIPVFVAHASAGFADALRLTGVTRRCPQLRMALLDGGGDVSEAAVDLGGGGGQRSFFAAAADPRVAGPGGSTRLDAKVNPIYASGGRPGDPPFTVAMTWRLVEEGMITAEAFRAYVFTNPHRLCAEANPAFWEGTALEAKRQPARAAAA